MNNMHVWETAMGKRAALMLVWKNFRKTRTNALACQAASMAALAMDTIVSLI